MILNRAAKWTLSGVFAIAALASVSIAAPAANWLLTFTETAAGGYIVGNPAAPTKLVEYASYTCGHCAEFENDVAPQLKAQNIAGGKVSFEIRSLVRDPYDLTIAMLARCGGKGRFFGNHKFFMANQNAILANSSKVSQESGEKLKTGNVTGFMLDAFSQMGLSKWTKQRGITDAAAKTCLSDKAALQKIIAMTELSSTKYAITGTPAFLINDKLMSHAHDLASIQKALAAK